MCINLYFKSVFSPFLDHFLLITMAGGGRESSSGVYLLFFFVLSSLLAAKRDKRMRRGLPARLLPSGNNICQSTFLVSRHRVV